MEPAPSSIKAVVLFTDGGSRGNPGPAGGGVVVLNPEGQVLLRKAIYLGNITNNMAEYLALLAWLEMVTNLHPAEVSIRMDSELIVRHLNGQYKVRSADLAPLYRRTLEFIRRFPKVDIAHIPREQNQEADRLANLALDTGKDHLESFLL
jgi:ribonuclease HI